MTIGSVGGDPAQLLQLLREARSNRTKPAPDPAGGHGATTPPTAATSPAAPAPTPPAEAASKILTDLKSLFLDLQSANGASPKSASTTSKPGTDNDQDATTASTAATSTAPAYSTDVVQTLAKAFQAYGASANSNAPATTATALTA